MHPAEDGALERESRDETAPRLSPDEATQLVGHLAEFAAAQLPLAPGLRAAAAELPTEKRLAKAMVAVATSLELGQSLEQALASQRHQFPEYLNGLVTAGIRSGNLGRVLEQFVSFRRFATDVRRNIRLAISYPLVLLALIAGLFSLLLFGLAPQLAVIEQDLNPMFAFRAADLPYQPPENLRVLEWLSSHIGLWLPAIAATVVLLAVAGWLLGAVRVRWLLNRLPWFGHLGRYGGMAEWSQLLRLLVENQVPLPLALRLTAEGISDAELSAASRRLAERVERGASLAAAMRELPKFMPLVPPLIAWGESSGMLPAALDSIAELYLRRVELRSNLIRGIVPPVAFLIVAAGVLFVWSIFSAAITVLSSFSGPPPQPISFRAEGIFSVALLGMSILVSLRLVYPFGPSNKDILHALMQLIGRLLLLMSVVGFFLIAANGLGILLALLAIGVWGMAVFRFRQAQRAALVNLLTLALRRGLPLQDLVRAFAAQEPGLIGRQASQFADCLDAGRPLAEAATKARRLLPPQATLALQLGQSTHQRATFLEQATVSGRGLAGEANIFWGTALSLFALGTIGSGAVLFASRKLAPAYEYIFSHDFHRPLPQVTKQVFEFTSSSSAIVLLVSISICLVGLAIYLGLYELGWVRFSLPIADRLSAPRHSAVVLRWLATAVRSDFPLEPMLELLANRYPKRLIRARLRGALVDLSRGTGWLDGLRSRRLVDRADAAVLNAAARAGNLPWALEEAAAAGLRRLNFRLQALSRILLPLLILFIGGLVLLFCMAYLLPLAELINGLAKI